MAAHDLIEESHHFVLQAAVFFSIVNKNKNTSVLFWTGSINRRQEMKLGLRVAQLLSMFGICFLMGFSSVASAVDVAGMKMEDTARVNNQELKLNGAGIRYKVIFKVYAAGLYLTEKKNKLEDILAVPGAKRISLIFLRDIESDSFGQAFMDGIRKNTELAERSKFVSQELTMGQLFASVPEIKKGDVLNVDWIPGSGTSVSVNGKKLQDGIPDPLFYNALIRIWLGKSPADAKLKLAMMGETP
jgi:hypothetical protein